MTADPQPSPFPDDVVLDHPAWAALHGPHARFAERRGRVVRYPPDVSPILALPPDPDDHDWADLADLVGPGQRVFLAGVTAPAPAAWTVLTRLAGVQMVDTGLVAAPDSEAVRLTAVDVPEMLDLVARTEPGPFAVRTVELGTYLGIRRRGRLVAMAGERLHPPGFTEISAVCTDPDHRAQGLGTRLVRAVAYGIRERAETPFLHASADNVPAIRLYLALGFELRRSVEFRIVRSPESGLSLDEGLSVKTV